MPLMAAALAPARVWGMYEIFPTQHDVVLGVVSGHTGMQHCQSRAGSAAHNRGNTGAQANLAGYRAVVESANQFGRLFGGAQSFNSLRR